MNVTQCLKYKTQSSIMLNRFEAFNLSMISKMQNRRPRAIPVAASTVLHSGTQPTGSKQTESTVEASAEGTTAGAGGGSGAPGKKKKPKKKK